MRYTLNGLRKLGPGRMRVKRPILQVDLIRIRAVMDLDGSHQEGTMWELWLVQWKGEMRCGDTIKRRSEGKRPWKPAMDTHRGIIRIEIIRYATGNKEGENWCYR